VKGNRLVLWLLVLTGCVSNPVTGRNEIAILNQSSEVEIGNSAYPRMQQAEGGLYVGDPALNAYVTEVGLRLAAVSDRPDLPWEFKILDNSIPNAWTLPGGKIAINRGLLTELQTEAELAAVLGHEIVHAAARHGAKSLERGLLLQVGMIGLDGVLQDSKYRDILIPGGAVGASLIHLKYSRMAEFEADAYGIDYMAAAGYDPLAAVQIQEMFIRLASRGSYGWLDGLFATHPPSDERLQANRVRLENYPSGGFVGRERYQQAIAKLLQQKNATVKGEEAEHAFKVGNKERAMASLTEALKIHPDDPRLLALKGQILASKGDKEVAKHAFDEAIARNPLYYEFYLKRGQLLKNQSDLEKANALLETAEAHLALGIIARKAGDLEKARSHFQIAAVAHSQAGQQALKKLEDLP